MRGRPTKRVRPLPDAHDPIWRLGVHVVQLLAAFLDAEGEV